MYDMKQFNHARSYMKRAKDRAPRNFVFGPELLNLESNFAALDGKDDLAEKGLRLAVEREPDMEVLALDLAKILADRARTDEALTVINEALKRTKSTQYLKRLQADILGENGEGVHGSTK